MDAGDKTKQDGGAVNVRAKAIKCIGAAIDVDVKVLGLSDVQVGVSKPETLRLPDVQFGVLAPPVINLSSPIPLDHPP